MLLLQGTTPTLGFQCPIGSSPLSYTVLKNGGANPAGSGSIVAVIGDLYYIQTGPSDLDTLGPVSFEITTSNPGFNAFITGIQVSAVDPDNANNFGMSYLDIPVSSAGGGMTLATAFDGSDTVGELFKALAAFAAGELQTSGPIALFKNWSNTKNRLTVTLGPGGNRLSVVRDFS